MIPTVSVILPAYNRSATLDNAARSVLNQGYRDLELIIVDDASTEDLEPIVAALADPRVVYIRQAKNGGAAVARNRGLDAARGSFIAFQDSDDLWLPWKLQMQMDLLVSLPAEYGAVVHSKIVYGQGRKSTQYGRDIVSIQPSPTTALQEGEDQVKHFLRENRISLQNSLFRREAYPERMWFDEKTRANVDWAFSCALVQHTLVFESVEPVVVAFMSTDSVSRSSRKKAIGIIRIIKNNRKLFERYQAEYALNLWRVGRMAMRTGHRRMGARLCRGALLRHPLLLVQLVKQKLF